VGWSFNTTRLTYTADGGKRWSSADFQFIQQVNAFSLPARDAAYAVGDHGMIYRYRVVRSDLSPSGAIPAPLMPGIDSALAGRVNLLTTSLRALEKNARAVSATATGTAPDNNFAVICCAAEVESIGKMVDGVAEETSKFSGRYRSLNLILQGLQLADKLLGNTERLRGALAALKEAKDLTTASAAISELLLQSEELVKEVNVEWRNLKRRTGAPAELTTEKPMDADLARTEIETSYNKFRATLETNDFDGFLSLMEPAKPGLTMSRDDWLEAVEFLLDTYPSLGKTRYHSTTVSGDWAGYYVLTDLDDPHFINIVMFRFHRVAEMWKLSGNAYGMTFPRLNSAAENQHAIESELATNPKFRAQAPPELQ
jgi:hypothetical protein